ncbi:MAG: hypothetical protein QGM45_11690, partial [Anaerolineales bacterium]|nr:hypothetical protein [Anaerolineales bacterium]
MPATEKTWYNQSLLHTIFAVSSLLLLCATFLLFKADHDRPWKGYQRQFRSMEQRLAAMQQLEFDTAAFKERHDELIANLRWAQADALPEVGTPLEDAIGSFIKHINKQLNEDEDLRPPEADTEGLKQL